MKLIFCTALIVSLSINVPIQAQENNIVSESAKSANSSANSSVESAADQALFTQFSLSETLAIDQRIRDLLIKNVTVLNRPAEKIDRAELRLLRFTVRREIAGILATEGYFSPVIKFDTQTQTQPQVHSVVVHIKVDIGPATKVAAVQIDFVDSAVPAGLQQSIQSNWSLQKESIFRDEEWSQAKANAIEELTENSYAAAKISSSEAVVQDQKANLFVTLDSGPSFHIGELHIDGLNLYKSWLLERYHPPVKGEPYNRAKLMKFQRELQNSPYFSAVTVSIDPNPEMAAAVPVDVLVKERKEHDVGLAVGYSSNTGARGEVSYQDRDFFGDAYNLKSAVRIEQYRQIGYADIYLPPKPSGYLDSFGVLFERSDIAGLLIKTSSFGAKRVITKDAEERRLGLSFIFEQSKLDGSAEENTKALVGSIGRTWRSVNNVFDPRNGHITQADISGAAKALLSDQNFVRLYGKYQRWIPVGALDVVIVRVEGGYVLARDNDGIPEDFLFRAGGTASVRGYAYQSIGVNQAGGVAGGRALFAASAEYVHWLGNNWGVAGFVDVGDAANRFSDLKMKQGVGAGVRYKSPAGPIAIDLAYGHQSKQLRLDFSLGIAF